MADGRNPRLDTIEISGTTLSPYTYETMAGNIAMYERLGFTVTRREPHLGTDIVFCSRHSNERIPRLGKYESHKNVRDR